MKDCFLYLCIGLFLLTLVVNLLIDYKRYKIPAFNDDNCINALVGEYAREDAYGMNLMAHAIRNRGTLKGVYGFNAPHTRTKNKFIWEMASLAWFESEKEADPLDGATEWRSVKDLIKKGNPKGFTLTRICNGIYYYKKTAVQKRRLK